VVRQSGLGRGLGALIPPGDTPSGATGPGSPEDAATPPVNGLFVEIPTSSIRPNAFQPRQSFADEDIASLAASIAELGVLQPILVRPLVDGQYELIAGERRWRATQRAGQTTIPAIVRRTEDTQALEHALVENLHRVDLNAIEEAAAYQQLIDDFSFTHDEVARRVGRSRAAVSNTLRLLQLAPSIQKLIMGSQISAGHARALLGTADKAFQETQARRIVAEGLSVRAIEEAVRLREGKRSTAAPSPTSTTPRVPGAESKSSARPASLLELESVLADVLATRVAVDLPDGRKGRMVIDFADLADLERISRLIASSAQSAQQLSD
jgi:ParB family transcriptional regulator, chromosome partitioning protein